MAVPVTVLTGYVGSGKTTLLLRYARGPRTRATHVQSSSSPKDVGRARRSTEKGHSLVRQLPASYRVVLLKNEFGDVEVDTQLARESGIAGVEEMLNGCVCCVLVGQMETALRTLKATYKPDRIFVETSGSAFPGRPVPRPGPVAWKIRQLEPEGFKLDAILTVVDCVNFRGYADTSYTAKLQARYSDIILLTKHELVTERELDLVLDRVYDLNPDTPVIKTRGRDGVSPDLLLGLDSRLFRTLAEHHSSRSAGSATVQANAGANAGATKGLFHGGRNDSAHYDSELDTVSLIAATPIPAPLDRIVAQLAALPPAHVFRVKGVLLVTAEGASAAQAWLVNIAFGRYDPPTLLTTYAGPPDELVRMSFIGLDLGDHLDAIRGVFGLGGAADPIPPGVSITLHSRPLL